MASDDSWTAALAAPPRAVNGAAGLRIAYVVGLHPALSMTFVLSEVEALRRLGVEIDTISIRRATGEHLLSRRHQEAARTTYHVLPARLRDLVGAHLDAFSARPVRYLRTLAHALRLAPPGLRGALWQLFYFAEAMVVWRRCRETGIRHLHAHLGNVSADVSLLAARFADGLDGQRWTWSFTLHGSSEFYGVERNRLRQKVESAAFVACISQFTRSQLMAHVGEEHWDKLELVRCGLDLDAWQRRGPYGESDVILSIGRLIPDKGFTVLLQALRLLRDRGTQARVVLVGSGPKEADLRRAARELGVEAHVSFPGAVSHDDVQSYYEQAAIVCLPSFAEGIPLVLMEAMALEVPVVATAIMGVPELVEDGVTGVLVRPGDAEELASALAGLLGDREARERIGRAGRARVAEEFDIDGSARRLVELFSAVTEARA